MNKSRLLLQTLTAVLVCVAAVTVIFAATKPDDMRHSTATQLRVEQNWTTHVVMTGTPEHYQNGKTGVATISSDRPIHAPAEGETITLTAAVDAGDEDAVIKTVTWYVNGKKVQATSTDTKGSYRSTYLQTYEIPSTVYCVMEGTMDTVTGQVHEAGPFSLKTPVMTLGYEAETPPTGSVWSFSQTVHGEETVFQSKGSGDYYITATTLDGAKVSEDIEMKGGETARIIFREDGSVTFGDKELATGGTGYPELTVKLVQTHLELTGQPESVVANTGETRYMTVRAQAGGDQLFYQWYQKLPAEAMWTLIPGATESELEILASANADGAQYYCRVKTKYEAVSSDTATLTVCGYPVEKPAVTAYYNGVELKPNEWHRGVDTLRVTSSGAVAGTGHEEFSYSLDEGLTWKAVAGTTEVIPLWPVATESVNVWVKAYNALAPELSYTVKDVFLVDTVAPEFTVSGNPSELTTKNAILAVEAKDADSGLAPEAYSFDGGATWQEGSRKIFTDNQDSVIIGVRDAAGNIAWASLRIDKIDKTAPVVTVSGLAATWTNEPMTVRVFASDDNGLAAEAYSYDEGKTWTADASHTYTKNGSYTIRVKDAAGNVANEPIEVRFIDMTAPSLSVGGAPDGWVNEAVNITLTASDDVSGLAQYPYSFDGGDTWSALPTFSIWDNGILDLAVRDAAGNITRETLVIGTIDTTPPSEFSILGIPTEWTADDVRLTLTNVSDTGSGLAKDAYNWNNEGWSNRRGYTVTKNGLVTVQVRDKAGNITRKEATVSFLDKDGPSITEISGIPQDWQKEPATVTVMALDEGVGLALEAYSFDDGATWQSDPTAVFTEPQAVGLKVRDKAGNITYQPFVVKNVDAHPPTLSVSFLAASEDQTEMLVSLQGTDNVSKVLEYCFDYNETYPEFSIWTTENQKALRVGKTFIVACRDELGNMTTERITPSLSTLAQKRDYPLIEGNVSSVTGYTFGPISGDGKGVYLDTTSTKRAYQSYRVAGKTVFGLMVEITAAPLRGGVLSGEATIGGATYRIYWGDGATERIARERAVGRFVIEPSVLRGSARNATLKITVTEYETDTLETVCGSDTLSTGVVIDVTPPTVNMDFDQTNFTLTLNAMDAISGVEAIRYQITDQNGTSEWYDYTDKIALTTSSKVRVMAVDRVENVSLTDSKSLSVATSITEHDTPDDTFYYRTNLFDHYIYGTGKRSVGQAIR